MLTVGCSFKGLDEVKSYVWQAVLKKWVDNNRVDCTRSGCTLLGNNRKVTCQGQVCFKDWIKAGIMNAADMMTNFSSLQTQQLGLQNQQVRV